MTPQLQNSTLKTTLTLLLAFISTLFALPVFAAPGDLDPTFGRAGLTTPRLGNGAERLKALTIQPDGKLIVAGEGAYGQPTLEDGGVFTLARLNPDGTLDSSFADQGLLFARLNGFIPTAVTVQADGKIVAVGFGRDIRAFHIVRLQPDGTIDTSFGLGGVVVTPASAGGSGAEAVAIQPDGKIVVAGNVLPDSGGVSVRLIRLLPGGALDNSFDSDGKLIISLPNRQTGARSVQVQSDGKIVLIGESFTSDTGIAAGLLVRLKPNGSFDNAFDGDGRVLITSPELTDVITRRGVVQPDGKIVTTGWGALGNGFVAIVTVRHTANGALDTSFDGDGILIDTLGLSNASALAEAVSVQPDGKIVVAGSYHNVVADGQQGMIKRYNGNGTADTSFGDQGVARGPVASAFDHVALATGGAILAAGNHLRDIALLQVTATGANDTGFGQAGLAALDLTSGNSFIRKIALQADGKIIAAGFSATNPGSDDEEATRQLIVTRLNVDGSFDSSFAGDGVAETSIIVSALSLDLHINADGSLRLAALRTNPEAEQYDIAIVQMLSNGELDPAFGGGAGVIFAPLETNFFPTSLKLEPSGELLVTGYSPDVSQNPAINLLALARLLPDGTPDASFAGGYVLASAIPGDNTALVVAVQPDGKLVVAGIHSELVAGSTQQLVTARFTSSGALDASFGSNGYTFSLPLGHNALYNLHLQPDGKVLLVGSRLEVGGSTLDSKLVRLSADGVPDNDFGQAGIVTSQPEGDVVLQSDGKILKYAARQCNNGDGLLLQRFLPNGIIDNDFGAAGNKCLDLPRFTANTTLVQPDGKLLIGGAAIGSIAVARIETGGVAPSTANVTIELDVIRAVDTGSEPADHAFAGSLGDFLLEDPARTLPNLRSFTVNPGSQTLAVTPPNKHRILAIRCAPAGVGVETRNGAGVITGVSITALRGDEIHCVVTSLRSENGKILVKIRNGEQRPEGLTVSIRNTSNGAEFSEVGATQKGEISFRQLPLGVYEVCEALQPDWINPTPCVTVELYEGKRSKSVTFHNQPAGAVNAVAGDAVVIADEVDDPAEGEAGKQPIALTRQVFLPLIEQR